jgi:serine phosphatase RsbU (regulator of sigma subunit)
MKPVPGGLLIAVGDCTGHGVPGALMSIMTVSLLDQIVERADSCEPGRLLEQLNRSIKQTLNQEGKDGLTDDGLDFGMCLLTGEKLVFAGAGSTLYVHTDEGLDMVEGSKKALGYRRTAVDQRFDEVVRTIGPNDTLYMLTDGLADQNGGEKDYSYGKKRWKQWIADNWNKPLTEQQLRLEEELVRYQGSQPQRDDITVLAFRMPKR